MGNLQDKVNTIHGRTKNLFSEFGNVAPRVLILGLDGAGKTTLLYKAKLNSTMFANVPPIGINIEEMTPKRGATIAVWDMRGEKLSRHLWRNYYLKTEAIVFVVDSADQVRLDEAQYELSQILESRYLSRVPLVVVANKQDAEGALGPDEVSGLLELGEIKNRHWSILGTNSKKGKGVKDVFKEVVNLIKLTRKEKLQRKNELLKKHNDNLKETKDTEIEIKLPQEKEKLDESDDSIKKYSLFENINKSNSVSEDGNENKSDKSDQYDTVFDENTNSLTDNTGGNGDEKPHDDGIREPDEPIVEDISEPVNDAYEIDNGGIDASKTDEEKRSESDIKVTDLDSDTDESLPDNTRENDHGMEPDETSQSFNGK